MMATTGVRDAVVTLLVIVMQLKTVDTALHGTQLLWTEKETSSGFVYIKGVQGDPSVWMKNRAITPQWLGFSDNATLQVSRHVALAFNYKSRDLMFTDRGLKSINRFRLPPPSSTNAIWYNVYSGTSTQVNGLAMDWSSGSIYWTDALYNWITVANALGTNIYNHIITTGLLKPQAIAVYPQKGLLFWSDIGAVPKIELSRLDGTGRANFITGGIYKPQGLTIDYDNDQLYWVDNLLGSIEHVTIADGTNRVTIRLTSLGIGLTQPSLFGIALYKDDYIFASEQTSMSILVLNKTTEQYVGHINAAIFSDTYAIPYDVIMYDSSGQSDMNSSCAILQCSDMCVSDGGNLGHCICRGGYLLNTTNKATCYPGAVFEKPQYVFSVGEQLCGTSVQVTDFWDTSLVKCFFTLPAGHKAVGLGFHNYANMIFFSDANDEVIYRIQVDTGSDITPLQIAANTGPVKGIAVDWLADNLYWADEEHGYIIVSRLSGRYTKVLIKNLYRPTAINVNPLEGVMYWVSNDTIYTAKMDGTNVRVLLTIPNSALDGMVLDILRNRLFFVDSALPGIRSVKSDGSDLKVVVLVPGSTFQDVTVFQSYLAWTSGSNYILFGLNEGVNSTVTGFMQGILFANTSHDIMTYGDYLQPSLSSGQVNPCDIDDDLAGCQQLCLLVPGGTQPQRRCNCSVGFRLSSNLRTCVSDPITDNFLLVIDPFMKATYQLNLAAGAPNSTIIGIDLSTSTFPDAVGYDFVTRNVYWHDKGPTNNGIKFKNIGNASNSNEYSLSVFSNDDVAVGSLELLPSLHQLVFTDRRSNSLFVVDSLTPFSVPVKLSAAINVSSFALAADLKTSDVYWIESERNGTVQSILTCNAGNCMNRFVTRNILRRAVSSIADSIVGLSLTINSQTETFVTFWTRTQVWQVSVGNSSDLKLLAQGNNTSNFTKVSVVDGIIYFVDWNYNSVWLITGDNIASRVTEPAFSRLVDLKVYRSVTSSTTSPTAAVLSTTSAVLSISSTAAASPTAEAAISASCSEALTRQVLGCIIAALVILILILIIVIVLLAISYRSRKIVTSNEHDNPTYYISHAKFDESSNSHPPGSRTTRSPTHVSYAVGGPFHGVTFPFDPEEENPPTSGVGDEEA